MKKIFVLVILVQLFYTSLLAQNNSFPPVDKSPMDMSYYPNNYPVLKIQDKISEPLLARVIYSRPQTTNRPIFGGLVKFGELWRMGANEATEIEFYKQVKIGGKKIPKGRYTVYAIVNESNWTIILNSETDTWGSFKYDAKKDVVRTLIPVLKTETLIESLAMSFEKTTAGFNLNIAWEYSKASLPISL